MRFAYIDSKGNEVSLEGVEGLALRVQIGAITPDTRLYDASADRWAPAREHPIYQNLVSSGEQRGKGRTGPGAGPPAPDEPEAASPPAPVEEEPEAAEAEKKDEPGPADPEKDEPVPVEPEMSAEIDREDPPSAPAEEKAVATPEEPETPSAPSPSGAAGLDWDGLQEEEGADADGGEPQPTPTPAAQSPAEDPGSSEDDPFDLGGDLTLDDTSEPEEESVEASSEEADETPSFEMEGGLELEEPPEPEEPSVVEEPPVAEEPRDVEEPLVADGSPGEAGEPQGGAPGRGSLDLTDMAGEMAWASEPEEESKADTAPSGERMRDPNPFGPESPDAEDAEDAEDAVIDAGSGSGGAGAPGSPPSAEADASTPDDAGGSEDPVPPRQKAPRPEHWKDRKIGGKKSRIPLVLAAVLLLAAGGGGAWYFLAGPGASGEEEVVPMAPRPPLAEALVPVMERVGAAAHGDFLEWVVEGRAEGTLGTAPGEEWLQGRYFANASTYPEVRDYWSAWSAYLEDLRNGEREAFGAAVDAHLAAEDDLDAGSGDALRARILWEFDRAEASRELAYGRIGDLAGAALDFHELLVRREDDIRYDPASSGVSQDPILEVVPSDPALRSEMNQGIDRVLGAISESGARPPLTTPKLVESLERGLRNAEPF